MKLIILSLIAVVLVSGCAWNPGGNVYARKDLNRAWTVDYGRVTDVEEVAIEGHSTQLGTIGGGLIGHEAGRTVGGGRGRQVAGAVGAVAGAVAGAAIEKQVRGSRGYQIAVELKPGQSIVIVQSADQEFAVGERVKVLRRRDGAARVTKA